MGAVVDFIYKASTPIAKASDRQAPMFIGCLRCVVAKPRRHLHPPLPEAKEVVSDLRAGIDGYMPEEIAFRVQLALVLHLQSVQFLAGFHQGASFGHLDCAASNRLANFSCACRRQGQLHPKADHLLQRNIRAFQSVHEP